MNMICYAIAIRILKWAGYEASGAGGVFSLLAIADCLLLFGVLMLVAAVFAHP
jgi:lipoprotein signal peptidase